MGLSLQAAQPGCGLGVAACGLPFVGRVNTAGVNPLYSESFHDMHQNSSYFNYKNLSFDEIVSKNFLITGRVCFLHNNLFFIYNDYLDIISDLKSNFIFPTSTCTPFSKKIFITTNGKILPCEKIGHNYCLGNLNNGEISLETVSKVINGIPN